MEHFQPLVQVYGTEDWTNKWGNSIKAQNYLSDSVIKFQDFFLDFLFTLNCCLSCLFVGWHNFYRGLSSFTLGSQIMAGKKESAIEIPFDGIPQIAYIINFGMFLVHILISKLASPKPANAPQGGKRLPKILKVSLTFNDKNNYYDSVLFTGSSIGSYPSCCFHRIHNLGHGSRSKSSFHGKRGRFQRISKIISGFIVHKWNHDLPRDFIPNILFPIFPCSAQVYQNWMVLFLWMYEINLIVLKQIFFLY